MRRRLFKNLITPPCTEAVSEATAGFEAAAEELRGAIARRLERSWAAMPAPKWVIAVGDCGAGCGVFADSYACVGAVSKVLPVDLVIRGCPPTPAQLLQGLLWLLRADGRAAADMT